MSQDNSPETNPFEAALAAQQMIVSVEPVDNESLFTITNELEQTGLKQLGAGELNVQKFAGALHEVFSKIANLEVVPPLDEEQIKKVAGKVSVYATLVERSAPKKSGKQAKTNPDQIRTDDKKS